MVTAIPATANTMATSDRHLRTNHQQIANVKAPPTATVRIAEKTAFARATSFRAGTEG